MSSTRSTTKGVSADNQQSRATKDEGAIAAGRELINEAVQAGIALIFGTGDSATPTDEEATESDWMDGYAYRAVASEQSSGLAYPYQREEVETVEDAYDHVFEKLTEATAPQRKTVEIATGVTYDRTINGVPSGQIGQREAEQGRLDRGTDRLINGAWGGTEGPVPEGKSLYTEERIEAREWELEQIRKQAAGEFTQDGRGERTQHRTVTERRASQQEREERVIGSYREQNPDHDPQRLLGEANPELLGEVNQSATRLAEKYDQHRAAIARSIAAKVSRQHGTSMAVGEAMFSVKDEILADETVIRPIAEIDSEAEYTSTAGRITTLYYPSDDSIFQVGMLEDDTGSLKFTMWRKSNPNAQLREGDEVVIWRATPDTYRGLPTLSIRHDTVICIREKGDGPAKTGTAPSERSAPTPQRRERISAGGCAQNGEAVIRPDHDRRQFTERTVFTADLVPETFHDQAAERPDVGTVTTDSISSIHAQGDQAYAITTRRRFDTEREGWSWAKQKRHEAKEASRRQRLMEDKYGQKDFGSQRVNDAIYKKRLYKRAGQGWGLNRLSTDWDLPWPGHEQATLPTLDDTSESL